VEARHADEHDKHQTAHILILYPVNPMTIVSSAGGVQGARGCSFRRLNFAILDPANNGISLLTKRRPHLLRETRHSLTLSGHRDKPSAPAKPKEAQRVDRMASAFCPTKTLRLHYQGKDVAHGSTPTDIPIDQRPFASPQIPSSRFPHV